MEAQLSGKKHVSLRWHRVPLWVRIAVAGAIVLSFVISSWFYFQGEITNRQFRGITLGAVGFQRAGAAAIGAALPGSGQGGS
jgi:hypothetical protein